ncbi:hypothetical protein ACZ91_64860, partial [Streptomyces regensis]
RCAEPDPEREPEQSAEVVRPARSASKADWVRYAVGSGMPEADAEAMTRDQLAEHYTEGGGPDGGDD